MKSIPVKYNDRLFRWVLALAGAYFVTEFGGEDGYFSYSRLFTRAFLIEFGSSLVIAFTLVELVAWITRFLDKRYDWQEQTVMRICLQATLGVMVPALLDFFLASLYFKIFGGNIFDSIYLQYAMPYIIVLITLFNMYYVIHYFCRQTKTARRSASMRVSAGVFPSPLQPLSSAPVLHYLLSVKDSITAGTVIPEKTILEKPVKQVFLVNKGTESVLIPVDDICCFFHQNEYNFLHTFQKETFMIVQSLDEVEKSVCRRRFFRLNRQIIINHKAFNNFVVELNGKLAVSIKPPLPAGIPSTVSQKKAAKFKQWLDR